MKQGLVSNKCCPVFNSIISGNQMNDVVTDVITDSTGSEMHISDLFILYNLLLNNNAFGSKTFTKLFENFKNETH